MQSDLNPHKKRFNLVFLNIATIKIVKAEGES